MKIKGIGNVGKSTILSVLTRDAKASIESGDMSWEEAGEMYKLEQVKRNSKIGSMHDTFAANYARIPESVYDKLPPEDVAKLVDAFYECYSDGKANWKRGLNSPPFQLP